MIPLTETSTGKTLYVRQIDIAKLKEPDQLTSMIYSERFPNGIEVNETPIVVANLIEKDRYKFIALTKAGSTLSVPINQIVSIEDTGGTVTVTYAGPRTVDTVTETVAQILALIRTVQ